MLSIYVKDYFVVIAIYNNFITKISKNVIHEIRLSVTLYNLKYLHFD